MHRKIDTKTLNKLFSDSWPTDYKLIIQSPWPLPLLGRWLANKLTVLLRGCGNCLTLSLYDFLSNFVHLLYVGSMLGQRRRRWPSIKTALDQCLV